MKKFTFKKQALVLTLVAALGVAVYLNYYFSDHAVSTDGGTLGEAVFVDDANAEKSETNGEAVAVDAKVDYFAQARKNREQARDEAVDIIKDIAADLKADGAAEKVLQQTTALTAAITQESKIEALIKAKGFEDCVAYIAQDGCSVVVKADNLTGAQTLQISEIVTAQSQIPAQKINIMATKS